MRGDTARGHVNLRGRCRSTDIKFLRRGCSHVPESGGSRVVAVSVSPALRCPHFSERDRAPYMRTRGGRAPAGRATSARRTCPPGSTWRRISRSRHRQPRSVFTEMRRFLRGHQTSHHLSEAPGKRHVTRVPKAPASCSRRVLRPARSGISQKELFPRNPCEQASLSGRG